MVNYQNAISKINGIFERREEESLTPQTVDSILATLSTFELAQLHGDLNNQALNGIYNMINCLEIPTEAKEHVTYRYFLVLTEQHEQLNNALFLQIINEYKKTKYLALESLIVYLLKEDKVNENDLILLKDIGTPVIIKEIYAKMMRSKIEKNQMLTDEDVKQLLRYEKYKILECALDKNLVEYLALRLFHFPEEGERNKKHKKVLFLKATQLLNN
ncbi:hypothetical protein RQP50_02375 [Paenibacillus sp. chi10]|uniref:Uncharacterized protein n=1 Tax=Paenibacillus suaedae TaxID=3077233 RepID=A0AAJ2JQW3_9BACL|nr:hypothetical protein [Paenibacillus sp. chi10]MDT8975086.1 hypothetical protein [Paenibacillus sp. chi10]